MDQNLFLSCSEMQTDIGLYVLKPKLPVWLFRDRAFKEGNCGASLVVQWLSLHAPWAGTQTQSPVEELRSHMLPGPAGEKKKGNKG